MVCPRGWLGEGGLYAYTHVGTHLCITENKEEFLILFCHANTLRSKPQTLMPWRCHPTKPMLWCSMFHITFHIKSYKAWLGSPLLVKRLSAGSAAFVKPFAHAGLKVQALGLELVSAGEARCTTAMLGSVWER